MCIVAKFGGSVLAEGSYWKKILNIVGQDDKRKIVVLSAIGKKFVGDIKTTDLLIDFCKADYREKKFIWEKIENKYMSIANYLDVDFLDILQNTFDSMQGKSDNFVISRGEFLSAKLFSKVSDYEYFEASKAIKFDNKNLLFELSQQLLSDLTTKGKTVLGGFYGSDTKGNIVLFERGGSDISGALVACATNADIYENWTDVSGLFVCDPAIILNPQKIHCIGYDLLKVLSSFGAKVLHPDSIYPVFNKKIPINIKSVFNPFDSGTLVTAENPNQNKIYGISTKKVDKMIVNQVSKIDNIYKALHCSLNNGQFVAYTAENAEQSLTFEGVAFLTKACLVCIVGGGDIGLLSCNILSKANIKNNPVYFDNNLKIIEVPYLEGKSAVTVLYNAFF